MTLNPSQGSLSPYQIGPELGKKRKERSTLIYKPLILLHQRPDRLKTKVTETKQSNHMDHSLVLLNETMSHAMYGHPRWTGHGGEF